MDKIEIGDIVLCVDARRRGIANVDPQIIEGNEYCVLDKKSCSCGKETIYVGTRCVTDFFGCMCGEVFRTEIGNHAFYGVDRFVKSKRQIAKKQNESLFVKLSPKKVLEPLIFINN